MHRVALPLAAARTMLLCPRHRASCAGLPPLLVRFLFSFSANFFCNPVTALSPPSLPDRCAAVLPLQGLPRCKHQPRRQCHHDDDHGCGTSSTTTATTTLTPHGATTMTATSHMVRPRRQLSRPGRRDRVIGLLSLSGLLDFFSRPMISYLASYL